METYNTTMEDVMNFMRANFTENHEGDFKRFREIVENYGSTWFLEGETCGYDY